jgi:FtsP/CotA-like multicopper oxidase with cupredoxin domain
MNYKKAYIIGSILSAITCVQAALHKYEFNITGAILNPDCHEQGYAVPLINGQFPGPTIEVTQGDELEILVRNQLNVHNTSIHYHGIRQIGTVEADGVPGVTQHSIEPGKSYTQKFKVENQAGTYFYHAHVGLQDDSVKGALIVYESDAANPNNPKNIDKATNKTLLKAGPYTYQKDLNLQLSEWWHDDLMSREDYYLGSSFAFDHGADSILMNGRTVFDPEKKGLTQENCQGYATFDVEPNSTYRLRVIGSTTFRTLALAIKNHNMTLIEVDGELTHPYNTSFLEIAPGQRYSALLHTGNHPPGTTFAIGTSYLWRQRGHGITENGFGYIRYTTAKEAPVTHLFKPIQKWSTHSFIDKEKKPDAKQVGGTNDKKQAESQKKPASNDKQKIDNTPNDKHGGDNKGGRGGGEGGGEGGGGGGRGRGKKPARVYADLPTFPNIDEPDWFYHQIKPLAARHPILDQEAVRTIRLVTTHHKMFDNTSRYMVNQRLPPKRDIPAMMHYDMIRHDRSKAAAKLEYNPFLHTYPVGYNETLDLVFQNMKSEVGGCLLHPWHTHGHSHYVIASGQGEYVHERDKNIRNFDYPLFRDTSVAYPSVPTNDTDGCGWTKVRLLTDNPGFWAVHCHITTHMIQGKMIVLEEAPDLIQQHKRYK